jgi:hypothetical protein
MIGGDLMEFMEIGGVRSGVCTLLRSFQISSNPHLYNQMENQ